MVPETPESFVYMLLDDDDEVVYVGQTRRGIVRPMEHKGSSNFCRVAIIPCEEYKLDVFESVMIEKYHPKNNRHPGRANGSLKTVLNVIMEYLQDGCYSMSDLKSDMKELGIEPSVIDYKVCLMASDVQKIIDYRSVE